MYEKYWDYESFEKVAKAVLEHKGFFPHNLRRQLAKEIRRTDITTYNMMGQISSAYGFTPKRNPAFQSSRIEKFMEKFMRDNADVTKSPEVKAESEITNGISERLQKLQQVYHELEIALVDVSIEIAKYQAQKQINALQAELEANKKVVEAAKKENLVEMIKNRMMSNF